MFNFFNSPVWHLIAISDWVSKYIIMLGLFLLSIVCIAIIIFKALAARYQKKQMRLLLKHFNGAKNLSEIATMSKLFDKSAGGKFLQQSLFKLKTILDQKQTKTLSAKDLEELEILLNQEVGTQVMAEEIYLPVLGTSASVSPLLGLFGTIIGLINCFISISQEKAADISVVAPGIAAALLTTLAGLIVAIPAMIAFHYFSNELRKLEMNLNDLSDLFLLSVRQNVQAPVMPMGQTKFATVEGME